ncbi:pro-sigmaK processing inhibitor BofA family protein [Tepidibacillus marianensis]|uniref:pro-sigmaK processing inhibitor BofA family protein n=1 Tax=Tepidibacillus marianensis TaxID=3131995 RepID=UPI0030CF60A0
MSESMMIWWGIIILAGILVFVFFGQTFLNISKWLWYGILHMAIGGILIYIVNLIGSYLHFHIPINPITAITIGVLGFPGLLAFLVVRFLIVPL